MEKLLDQLSAKKSQLDTHRPLSSALSSNLQEWYKIELTYTSNAIEGNSLSRAETAIVVDKGTTVEGKSIREHLEAVNHAHAYEWMIQQSRDRQITDITEATLRTLHTYILGGILDVHAGRYRTIPVRIAGSTVVMPNALKVPSLMSQFIEWLHQSDDHPVKIAAEAHYRLVSIHPFIDGNGRTARLLMNLILLIHSYPPAIIDISMRKRYITSIEQGQLGGSLDDYYNLICECVSKSLDIYLDSLSDEDVSTPTTTNTHIKIGILARESGESVSTIRHWTRLGLITVDAHTPGGYQLYTYDAIKRVRTIRELQSRNRLSLSEIKERLTKQR